jgi:hypothetical protein
MGIFDTWKNGQATTSVKEMDGAVGDGVHDDTAAIQRAIDRVVDADAGKVYFPGGNYLITTPLDISDRITLESDGNATITAGAVMDYMIFNSTFDDTYQHLNIRNIWLDGDYKAVNGINLYRLSSSNSAVIENVKVRHCTGDGIVLRACMGGNFNNIFCNWNNGWGISIQGCNSAKFLGLECASNQSGGIYISNLVGYAGKSGSVNLWAPHSEGNTGNQIKIENATTTVNILGGWVENINDDSDYDAILCLGSKAFIGGGLLIVGIGYGDNYAVNLSTGGPYSVEGINFSGTNGFPVVHEGTSHALTVIRECFDQTATPTVAYPLSTSAEVLGTTIVTNGDMELNSSWSGSDGTASYSSYHYKSPTHTFKFIGNNAASKIYQAQTFTPGRLYFCSAWTYTNSGCTARILINDGVAATGYTSMVEAGWVWQSFYFVAKGTTGEFAVECVGAGGTFYIDDVIIQPVLWEGRRATCKIHGIYQYFLTTPAPINA